MVTVEYMLQGDDHTVEAEDGVQNQPKPVGPPSRTSYVTPGQLSKRFEASSGGGVKTLRLFPSRPQPNEKEAASFPDRLPALWPRNCLTFTSNCTPPKGKQPISNIQGTEGWIQIKGFQFRFWPKVQRKPACRFR